MLSIELYGQNLRIFTHTITSTMFLVHDYCISLNMTHISQDSSNRMFNLHCGRAQHVPEKKRIGKRRLVTALQLDLHSNMD